MNLPLLVTMMGNFLNLQVRRRCWPPFPLYFVNRYSNFNAILHETGVFWLLEPSTAVQTVSVSINTVYTPDVHTQYAGAYSIFFHERLWINATYKALIGHWSDAGSYTSNNGMSVYEGEMQRTAFLEMRCICCSVVIELLNRSVNRIGWHMWPFLLFITMPGYPYVIIQN